MIYGINKSPCEIHRRCPSNQELMPRFGTSPWLQASMIRAGTLANQYPPKSTDLICCDHISYGIRKHVNNRSLFSVMSRGWVQHIYHEQRQIWQRIKIHKTSNHHKDIEIPSFEMSLNFTYFMLSHLCLCFFNWKGFGI